MSCYKYEKKVFNEGLLDNSIDATYIIHLENNGRLPNILEQLNIYQPSKIVYILFNKGYKKCKKNLLVQSTTYDLVDAFLHIFKDANNKKYNNILILEDDFIFNKKIKNKKVINDINKFIKLKVNEEFIYLLGTLPFFQIPYEINHFKLLSSLGTHACIYSKKAIDTILKKSDEKIDDWDTFTNFNFTRYLYKEPLCYQLFPETDNFKNWNDVYGNISILKIYLKSLNLDKKVEPGYSINYFISIFWFYLFIFFLLLILFYIYLISNTKDKNI